ncbi:MAG: GMC family oxidoreductase N-terminal domain-containing protein [Deltaproteobacteria bacterium]|nr:GMC family oxidoreductase N-terminal domain-containing protein [Deltaproteobacteria bacterium]
MPEPLPKAASPTAAAIAVCRAIVPRGRAIAGVTEAEVERMYAELGALHARVPQLFNGACALLDSAAVARTGQRFARLASDRQQTLLAEWLAGGGPVGALLGLVASAVKLFYFDGPELCEHFGVPHDKAPRQAEPAPRFAQQVVRGCDLDEEELETDVLVIGSGASGAVVAKELAERGHAVLVVESGRYFQRQDFKGQALHAFRTVYDWRVQNLVLGNLFVPVPAGRTVGGSTTINTATCLRPPAWVHRRWVEEGLPELSEERMAPFFDEVETRLEVAPTPERYWGRGVERMARVAEARGFVHGPLPRNAPGCDGQNTCDMGCPSGGKGSMDRTFIPAALRAGALLLTETTLEQLVIRQGKVRGAVVRSHGKGLRVRARTVVLACGSFNTPRILWEHDLGGEAVGRGLTIHPSGSVSARLPEVVRGFDVLVSSPYGITHFQDRGLLLVAANLPLDMAAIPLQLVGRELVAELEAYDRFATYGAMIAETSRGRLRRGPRGQVLTSYFLNDGDVTRLHEGLSLIADLYFEAGAQAVFPAVRTWPVLRSRAELDRFRAARLSASDLVLSAFHPLGTCRMGRDPRSAVVGPDYRLRGLDGLYLVDGSVVPGPIAVNSQITIMAFARRAVETIHRALTSTRAEGQAAN